MSSLIGTSTGSSSPLSPPPNFTASKSIVLHYPLEQVFSVLATADFLESVVRLSGLVTSFTLGNTGPIAISPGSLSSTRGTTQLPSSSSSNSLYRTGFVMEETVPILGGLLTTRVAIEGSQTEDRQGRCCLYESAAQKQGITIWKLRAFEEVDVDGRKCTKVTENIEGRCPDWMRWFVERDCRSAHRAHMDAYQTLFN